MLICLSAQGQFIKRSRLPIRPHPPDKPFYLTLDGFTDDGCGPYGVIYTSSRDTFEYQAPITISNGVGSISNLWHNTTYCFQFRTGDCSTVGGLTFRWRPPRTNYVTVSLAGTSNSITLVNPQLPVQFWKLQGTSWTSADLLATDDLNNPTWPKVWSFNYPSSTVPNLIVTSSNSWAGLDAYEHPQ